MKQLFRLLFILTAIAARMCYGCPYYKVDTLGMIETRTNYSTFEEAYFGATSSGVAVHVCHGAIVAETETLPVLTQPVVIVGDSGGEVPIWAFENTDLEPLILVQSNGVVLRDLRIEFKNTLMLITGPGHVTIEYVTFFGGETPLIFETDETGDTGMTGDHVFFYSTGVAMYMVAFDTISCVDCHIYNARTGGYVTQDIAMFDNLVTQYNVLVDVLVPFGTRASLTSAVFAVTLSPEYIARADLINARTYPTSSDPTFGSGGSSSGSPSKRDCSGLSTKGIVYSTLFGLTLLGVIFALAASVYSNPDVIDATQNEVLAKKK